jgi:hypothetical protein
MKETILAAFGSLVGTGIGALLPIKGVRMASTRRRSLPGLDSCVAGKVLWRSEGEATRLLDQGRNLNAG